jgi:hypothetical protein
MVKELAKAQIFNWPFLHVVYKKTGSFTRSSSTLEFSLSYLKITNGHALH